MKQNHIKLEISKKIFFQRETLAIRKGLWNEIVRLREEQGKFAVINYDRIYQI